MAMTASKPASGLILVS
jgi:hypothetical protein